MRTDAKSAPTRSARSCGVRRQHRIAADLFLALAKPCQSAYSHRSAGLGSHTHSGRGRSSGVEHNLAKVGVESSNLFARSRENRKKTNIIKALLGYKGAFA